MRVLARRGQNESSERRSDRICGTKKRKSPDMRSDPTQRGVILFFAMSTPPRRSRRSRNDDAPQHSACVRCGVGVGFADG